MRPLLLLFLVASAAFADALFTWQPTTKSPRFILSRTSPLMLSKSVDRYLKRLPKESLWTIFEREVKEQGSSAWLTKTELRLPEGKTDLLPVKAKKVRIALVANDVDDMMPAGERISHLVEQFELAGADVYVIPLGADLVYPLEADREKFREKVSKTFDALVAIGGDDIAPSLSQAPAGLSTHFHEVRDQAELKWLRRYLKTGCGPLFGICRGQQLTAVALGHALIGDLPTQKKTEAHANNEHEISIGTSTKNILYDILKKTEAEVYCAHHQAVIPRANSPLKVNAVAESGDKEVVESMQTDDRKVFLVQFHPELMDDETGKKILQGMVAHAKKRSCHRR